jgi:hypothetical protein
MTAPDARPAQAGGARLSEALVTKAAEAPGLPYDCPRCGTRHLLACCHASRHNLCDRCVAEQHAARAARLRMEESDR